MPNSWIISFTQTSLISLILNNFARNYKINVMQKIL